MRPKPKPARPISNGRAGHCGKASDIEVGCGGGLNSSSIKRLGGNQKITENRRKTAESLTPGSIDATPPFKKQTLRQNLPRLFDAHEKAPEMFNHFRGFVLFNNGGEIGTSRIARSSPLKPTDTDTFWRFATNSCYKSSKNKIALRHKNLP